MQGWLNIKSLFDVGACSHNGGAQYMVAHFSTYPLERRWLTMRIHIYIYSYIYISISPSPSPCLYVYVSLLLSIRIFLFMARARATHLISLQACLAMMKRWSHLRPPPRGLRLLALCHLTLHTRPGARCARFGSAPSPAGFSTCRMKGIAPTAFTTSARNLWWSVGSVVGTSSPPSRRTA